MSCSNCYSGCTEISSDKCVKYTGVDIPLLDIKNGDSINYVQAAVIGFLVSTLDGSGIKYELDPTKVCAIVSDELANCTDITVVEITNALSAAICAIDTRVTAIESFQTTLEGAYTPDCVPGITGTEGTHAVLQAVINQLCTVTTDLDALELDVSTNYVPIADINTYIENYLGSLGSGTEQKLKMIPYTVMEYYGSLTYFDATGAGTGDWAEIYLCNGNNGTPDKRGRIAVGTTSGMGGGSFPSATDPLVSGNPTYYLYTTTGVNTVTLTQSEIPSHSHIVTIDNAGDHSHFIAANETDVDNSTAPNTINPINRRYRDGDSSSNYTFYSSLLTATVGVSSTSGDHTHTASSNAIGGGSAHNNIPPVLACHYIIYIPTT